MMSFAACSLSWKLGAASRQVASVLARLSPAIRHCLAGHIAGTVLRANVVGRGQGQVFAVPEAGMVAGVVVSVAAQDVEHEPPVEFVQRRLR